MQPRRLVLLIFSCLGILLLAAPASGARGPNLTQLRQEVHRNPQNPEAHYQLGMKYLESGRSRQAAKCLKEAIRLKPDYVEALDAMAKLKNAQGDYGDAVKDLKKMTKLRPNDTELRDRLSNEYNKEGLASLQANRLADAETAFKKAAENSPADPVPLNNLGVAYLAAGRTDEAARSFQEAVRRDPNNADAHYNLAMTFLSSGNRVGAYAEYLNLRNLNPGLAGQLDPLINPPRTPLSGPYLK